MRVVILGLGGDPEWVEMQAPKLACEIWTINDWWWRYPRLIPDRALQLHSKLPDNPLPESPERWRDWIGQFRRLGNRAIVSEHDPRLPEALVAGTAELEKKHGGECFTSSCACAVMIARHRFCVDEIILAGVPLRPHEFDKQAPGIMRAITNVESYGARVIWPTRDTAVTVDWKKVSDVEVWGYWRK